MKNLKETLKYVLVLLNQVFFTLTSFLDIFHGIAKDKKSVTLCEVYWAVISFCLFVLPVFKFVGDIKSARGGLVGFPPTSYYGYVLCIRASSGLNSQGKISGLLNFKSWASPAVY